MAEGLPVLDHPLPHPATPGRPDARNAAAVVEIIARAVALAQAGEALAVCTNPIAKALLKAGRRLRLPRAHRVPRRISAAPSGR